MKFQNCILINFVTDGRTDGRTDAHTDKTKAICPFNFSKVGGIKVLEKFSQNEKGSTNVCHTNMNSFTDT